MAVLAAAIFWVISTLIAVIMGISSEDNDASGVFWTGTILAVFIALGQLLPGAG